MTGCTSQAIIDARVRTVARASGSESGGRRDGDEGEISLRNSSAARDWVIVTFLVFAGWPYSTIREGTVKDGLSSP